MGTHMKNQFRSMVFLATILGGATSGLAQGQSAESSPNQLTFQRVLMSGEVKIYPTLADVNADSKPDLLIGSMGHDFEDKTSRIVFSKERGLELSVHRNTSSAGKVSFDKPYWPKGLEEQCCLPGG